MKGNLFLGARYFIRGFALLSEPGIRRYVAWPIIVNAVVLTLTSVYSIRWLDEGVQSWLPGWLSWLYWLIFPIAVLTLLLVLAYFFSTVLMVIASPFYGLLSEKIEKRAGVEFESEALMSLIRRTIGRELTKLVYVIPRYLGLLILSFIPVVNLASPVLWFWFGSWVLALQYTDYSYDNHGRSFNEARQQLGSRSLTAWGFGGVVALLMVIPVVNWFVMPAAVIGGT